MNKFEFKTRYGTFTRVTKREAKKLFTKHHETIYMVACKCRCDYSHPLTYPACIDYNACKEYVIDDIGVSNYFDNIVNSFEYYNCNHELGYYASFYIKTDIAY